MKYFLLIGLLLISKAQASEFSEFWLWFKANQADFPTTTDFDAKYGSALSEKLSQIDPGLVYEIAIPENENNELIISADGIRELIPSVQELVNTAPTLDNWEIIAFRPRMDDYANFTLRFGERIFNPKKLWCWSRVEDGNFDLIIYHPDFTEENRNILVNGTYILLDMALGEFDVMTNIRYIDHQELPNDPKSVGLYRFEELRHVFDEYKSTVTH